MTVIPSSHMVLSRSRKALNSALERQDWQSVGALDKALAEALSAASDDPGRDTAVLLGELGHILKLYRNLVVSCQEQAATLASSEGYL